MSATYEQMLAQTLLLLRTAGSANAAPALRHAAGDPPRAARRPAGGRRRARGRGPSTATTATPRIACSPGLDASLRCAGLTQRAGFGDTLSTVDDASATFRERPLDARRARLDGPAVRRHHDRALPAGHAGRPDRDRAHLQLRARARSERVRFVAAAMRTLGDLAAGRRRSGGGRVPVRRLARRDRRAALFLEAVKVDQTAPVDAAPAGARSTRRPARPSSPSRPAAAPTASTARDVGDAASRAGVAARGLRKLAELPDAGDEPTATLRLRRRPRRAGRAAAAARRQRPPGHPRGGARWPARGLLTAPGAQE